MGAKARETSSSGAIPPPGLPGRQAQPQGKTPEWELMQQAALPQPDDQGVGGGRDLTIAQEGNTQAQYPSKS